LPIGHTQRRPRNQNRHSYLQCRNCIQLQHTELPSNVIYWQELYHRHHAIVIKHIITHPCNAAMKSITDITNKD
jgi:hypothetical protein